MKKLFIVTICFLALVTLNGQIVQERLPGAGEIINRRSPFNLEELKVRWKKAALENCPGVPCITVYRSRSSDGSGCHSRQCLGECCVCGTDE
jgi:hypothetical protein